MSEEIKSRKCVICDKQFNSGGFQIGYDVDDPYVLTSSVIRCYPILSDYNKLYESIEELYYEFEEEKSNSLDLYYEDLYFCSLECLKEFFNHELDKLNGNIDFHIPGVRF